MKDGDKYQITNIETEEVARNDDERRPFDEATNWL